ncbi:hypothetical protein FH583_01525 (plasmid) [Leptospira interrogans]|uniref:hypothetical protein n=1 Tax=Leptospira interrogans TaxID=173 RepID=UPI000345BAE5|nr:hypothetical protein [Leptospira interrogans]UML74644.1 hypothetical protein FH583_01525 [Leptospira interrogans]
MPVKRILNSSAEVNKSFFNLITYLFRKFPAIAYLFAISAVYFSLIAITSESGALVIYSLWAAIFSILVYIKTGKFSETTFTFFLGLVTVFALDWKEEKSSLFAKILFPTLFLYFLIDSLRFSGKNETILRQAAIFIDHKRVDELYKKLDSIVDHSTPFHQLLPLERSEIVRFLVFHKFNFEDMPRAIEIVEILKTTYMISLEKSIDHYWAIYNIVKSVDYSNITDYDLEEIIGIVVTIPISPENYANCIISNRTRAIQKNLSIRELNRLIIEHVEKGYDIKDFDL